jgi:hypothetical protein
MALLPPMAVASFADSGSQDREAFCNRHPTHPACSVIMNRICAQTPSDPACMSDEDDDDNPRRELAAQTSKMAAPNATQCGGGRGAYFFASPEFRYRLICSLC